VDRVAFASNPKSKKSRAKLPKFSVTFDDGDSHMAIINQSIIK